MKHRHVEAWEFDNPHDRNIARPRRPGGLLRIVVVCLVIVVVLVVGFVGLVGYGLKVGVERVADYFTIPESQFAGHPGVKCVAWSPDASLIASGSTDKMVHLWNAETAEQVRSLQHDGQVTSVAFSDDGSRIATASYWRDLGRQEWVSELRVWDPVTGDQLYVKEYLGEMRHLAFSPDGKWIAAASSGLVRVCDAESGDERLALAGHTASVMSVAWSPDGERLASASLDGTIRFWDPTSGDVLFSLNAEGSPFHGIAFSPDGKRLAACDYQHNQYNGTVRIWDIATQEELFSLDSKHTRDSLSVAYSPDGSRIACGALNSLRVFEASTGEQVFAGPISRSINAHYHMPSVAFSPNGRRVVGACTTNAVRVWELTDD